MANSNHAFSFYNAQVAFSCILKAFGIGIHDRVLLPGYTNSFISRTIHNTGAIPAYADIDNHSYNSLLVHYQEAYNRLQRNGTEKTLAALLIQHTYGNANLDSSIIINWAREKGLLVIEYFMYDELEVRDSSSLETVCDAAFYAACTKGVVLINNSKYVNIMATMEKIAPQPTLLEGLSLAAKRSKKHLLRKSHHARLTVQYLGKLCKIINLSGSLHRNEPSPREFFRGVGTVQHHIVKYYANSGIELTYNKQELAARYSELLRTYGFPYCDYSEKQDLTVYPVKVKNKQACLELAAKLGFELTSGIDYPEDCFIDDTEVQALPNAMAAAQKVVCLPLHNNVTHPYAVQIINLLASITAENTPPIGLPIQYKYSIHLTAVLEHLSNKTVKSLRKIPWFGFKI